MFKSLLKKQLMEVNDWIFRNKKTGQTRSSGGMVALILLYVLIFGMIGFMFFTVSVSTFGVLSTAGLDWLYFALMGLISILLGIFGSVFTTYSSLYKAKDNDLLLSLPIPLNYVIFVRLFGVWMWSTIYSAIVFIPAMAVYNIFGGLKPLALITEFFLFLAISFFVLTLACLLGWVIAKISVRIKNRSFVTVILSLAFLAIYYVVYFRANEILQGILKNADNIGQNIKGFAYPLYSFGCGCIGNLLHTVVITLAVALLSFAVFAVLKRSFIKLATSKDKVSDVKFNKNTAKEESAFEALFKKELKRFTSSSAYMLNCALGTVILPLIGILALVKGNSLMNAISSVEAPQIERMILVFACVLICAIASLNDITAPSVSLEGKNIWLVRSLPVSPWLCLKAKLALHLAITLIPLLFCSICIGIVISPSILGWIVLLIFPSLFVLFIAALGLAANLLFPNLNWTNEIIPIKQSFTVVIPMLAGILVSGVLIVLYFVVETIMPPEFFLLICSFVITACDFLILLWIYKKGTKIFTRL